MKKILFIIALVGLGFASQAQTTNPFPTTDSLRKFINKWIRNSAVDAFTNLRLNTAMIGITRFIDSSDANGKLSISDTAAMLAGYTRLSRFMDSVAALRAAIAGAGSGPTGPENSLQYKSGGIFVGDAGLIYNATTNTVTTDSVLVKKIISDSARTVNQLHKATINAINAFGNSITVSESATAKSKGYIYLIADTLQVPLSNYALSGSGARYMITQHHKYVSGIQNANASFIMVGYNDIPLAPVGINPDKTYNKVINGIKSAFVNHFADGYQDASGLALTTYGTWTFNQDARIYGGKTDRAAYTSTLNDSIVWQFKGTNVSAVLRGGDSTNYNSSIVEVFVDNVSHGLFNTNNQSDGGIIAPYSGDYSIPYSIIITGLSNDVHKIKVVNRASRFMYVDYFTTLSPNKGQFVVFDNILYRGAAQVATGNTKIDSLMTALPAGFQRLHIYTNSVFNSSIGGDADLVHPNDAGHAQILKAFRNAHDSSIVHTEGTMFRVDDDYFVVHKAYKKIPGAGEILNKSDGNIKLGGWMTIPTWGGIRQGYSPVFAADSVRGNLAIGSRSSEKTTGTSNTTIGEMSNANNATNFGLNTLVGSYSGYNNQSGGIVGIGASTLYDNSTGQGNAAGGTFAMRFNNTGNFNSAWGGNALFNNISGNYVSGFGYETLRNSTGWYNTAFGASALLSLTAGQGNIAVGPFAGNNLTSGNYNTNISYQGYFPNTTGDGQLNIVNYLYGTGMTGTLGNLSAGRLGLHKKNPLYGLDIDGSVGITKDSVDIITTIGPNYLTTIDTANGKIKRILPSNIITSATLATNQIGVGSSNLLSGSSALTYDGTTVKQENAAAVMGAVSSTALSSTSGARLFAAASALPTASTNQLGAFDFVSRNGASDYLVGAQIGAQALGAWTATTNMPTALIFRTTNTSTLTEKMRITGSGNAGIGVSNPLAVLHLKAGTSSAATAPLKFTAGTNMSTFESGAMEFDGTVWWLSTTAGRFRLPLQNNSIPVAGSVLVGDGGGNFITDGLINNQDVTSTSTVTLQTFDKIRTLKVNATSGNITLTLTADHNNQIVNVKRMDNSGNTITIQSSSGNIDGAASITIPTQYQNIQLHWDGSNWLVL